MSDKRKLIIDTDCGSDDAVAIAMGLAKRCNKYIDETTPWVLAKSEDKSRLNAVMYNLLEAIRFVGVMLKPIIPATCDAIAAQLGVEEASMTLSSVQGGFGLPATYTVGQAAPLFSRLDIDKVIEEIAAEAAAKAEAEKPAEPEAPPVTIDDFMKVELRAAKVVACEPIPKAKKLLKLTLDDGSGTPRIVASGIAPYYAPDDLVGKTVVVVANLKPATLCGVESRGMILAADAADGVKVVFLDGVAPGSRIR